MRADRAVAGLTAMAIVVAVGFAPGAFGLRQWIALGAALLVFLIAFAPILPWLNGLPKIGAPRVTVYLTFDPPAGSDDLSLSWMSTAGIWPPPRVLRVGFKNDGPRSVKDALINVLVDAPVQLEASDHAGSVELRGKEMPFTEVKGRPMRFWAEKGVTFPVGSLLLHYRLTFPDGKALGDKFLIRATYHSDDLYGGERVHEEWVSVIDTAKDDNA